MGTHEHRRRTVVRDCDDVVDDDSVYAGIVVWLGRPALRPDELARWDPAPHSRRGRARRDREREKLQG